MNPQQEILVQLKEIQDYLRYLERHMQHIVSKLDRRRDRDLRAIVSALIDGDTTRFSPAVLKLAKEYVDAMQKVRK